MYSETLSQKEWQVMTLKSIWELGCDCMISIKWVKGSRIYIYIYIYSGTLHSLDEDHTIYIYIYIYIEVNNGKESGSMKKIENKVIQKW